jgi:hypothetical protein
MQNHMISDRKQLLKLDAAPAGDRLECEGQDAEQNTDSYDRKEVAGPSDHRDRIEDLLEERRVADRVDRPIHGRRLASKARGYSWAVRVLAVSG